MFKLKKSLASALALSMMCSALPFQSSAEAIYSTEEGYYEMDSMVAYQYRGGTGTLTDDNYSMCNGVFASEAEVIISGSTATIYLYVANPTPGTWGGLSDGILNDFVLTYGGVEYPGTTTSIGMLSDGSVNPKAAVKLFMQDSSFFGITAGDKLACDTIEIPNVPVAALEEEVFHLTAYINLVMGSTQDFYLVPEYVAGGPGEVPAPSDPTDPEDPTTGYEVEKQVAITATVSASEENAPSYAITIPTDVALGDISSEADTTINYSIGLDLGDHEEISISVANSGTLTSGSETLAYTNTLNTTTYTANSTATGQLTIAQAAGAEAAEGDYTGTLTFSFTIS